MWKVVTLMLVIITVQCSITIPLGYKTTRCMAVYNVGETETVKLQIQFPPILRMEDGEYYHISWTNTETKDTVEDSSKPGVFKREIQLKKNIIYDICMQVHTYTDKGFYYANYSAENYFAVNHSMIKMPAGLMKSQDLSDTYTAIMELHDVIETFKEIQADRTRIEDKIYSDTISATDSIVKITVFEIIVIIMAAVLQGYLLISYLLRKQYI